MVVPDQPHMGVQVYAMAKKNQKTIKILKQIADELDNVGITDAEAWRKLSTELEGALKSIPKKNISTGSAVNLRAVAG